MTKPNKLSVSLQRPGSKGRARFHRTDQDHTLHFQRPDGRGGWTDDGTVTVYIDPDDQVRVVVSAAASVRIAVLRVEVGEVVHPYKRFPTSGGAAVVHQLNGAAGRLEGGTRTATLVEGPTPPCVKADGGWAAACAGHASGAIPETARCGTVRTRETP